MSLHGRVALVTGSTSGIGLGIARALAAEGADILMNGFGDPSRIERLRAETAETCGVRVAFSGADISKPDQARTLVAQARDELGGCDILVNNAGVQFTAPVEEFPDDQWERVIAINLSGAFYLSKAAYVAAKHGLIGLTKVTAIELANSGITANAICPGWVLTPLVQTQIDERAAREGRSSDEIAASMVAEKQPMHQFSTPETIGAAAVYLCSDGARTVTGISLSVDGGWTAQ